MKSNKLKTLRITSGSIKNRKINILDFDDLRPTKEIVREAVMSSVSNIIEISDSRVLDLYSGTGAFGFEALSRGASSVLFVEKNQKLCQELKNNLKTFDFEKKATVVNSSVHEYLSTLKNVNFDLIFSDPPYHYSEHVELISYCIEKSLLRIDGVLVLEFSSKSKLDIENTGIELVRDKAYGESRILIYRRVR